MLRIVWDEPKRETTLAERSLDFASLKLAVFEHARIEPARDGRAKAIGLLDGHCFVVIFKLLGGEALSVISMRYASKKKGRNMPKKSHRPPVPEAVIQRHVAEDGEGEFNFDRAMSWGQFRRSVGRPSLDPSEVKERITIRLDKDVLSKLR